ncbi:MAG: lactate utilization protein C [Proteobacteria bacterium]|nr:MAG: lactate utilization protein C [Pseudomonadota bacterium]
MNSKNTILSNIKEALKNSTYQKKEIGKADEHIKNEGDLLENCIKNLEANKTKVIPCKEDELFSKAQEILNSLGSKKLLISSDLPFNASKFKNVEFVEYEKSVNEMSEILFDCDTSIIKAKLAISNLGLFCVTSDEQPRLTSLLPQNCIILLKKEDVVASMNEAYELLGKEKTPTNIIYISGPSRTADIELVVVLGVHGPQKVYGLIY